MSSPTGTFVHALGHNWLGKVNIAVETTLLAITFVAVGLRLWTRRTSQVALQANDWFIAVATFFMLARYIVELLLVLLAGMGIRVDDVAHHGGVQAFIRFNKLTYTGELLWITVMALTQLSILHYYLQRFQQPLIKRLTYAVIGLCSALWAASLLATAFLCDPPRKVWLPSVEGSCGNGKMLHTGSAVSELILNTFIFLLPIPVIRHIQYIRIGKTALAITYLLGLIIIALSAVRIKTESLLSPQDFTHSSARASLLSNVVALLGIIVACLPVLAPASQRLNGSTECTSIVENPSSYPVSTSTRYWKATVLSSGQIDEPDIPLVTVTQPPPSESGRRFNEWAIGQIKITSDWEIHSTRNSTRLDKDSIRRG